jgi:hypothetical protein
MAADIIVGFLGVFTVVGAVGLVMALVAMVKAPNHD